MEELNAPRPVPLSSLPDGVVCALTAGGKPLGEVEREAAAGFARYLRERKAAQVVRALLKAHAFIGPLMGVDLDIEAVLDAYERLQREALEQPARYGNAVATQVLRDGGTITITHDAGEDGPDGYPAFYGVDGTDRHGEYIAAGCSLTSPAEALASLKMVQRGAKS